MGKNITGFNYISGKVIKALLIVSGTISFVLGILGIFLPLLPTTPFLLLSAACYAKSSEKFYFMLMDNKVFGKYIKNYRENRTLSLKIKILSITILWTTILITIIFAVENIIIRGLLLLIAVTVSIHILSIKSAALKNQIKIKKTPNIGGE